VIDKANKLAILEGQYISASHQLKYSSLVWVLAYVYLSVLAHRVFISLS
jgi:hypothetical protein